MDQKSCLEDTLVFLASNFEELIHFIALLAILPVSTA